MTRPRRPWLPALLGGFALLVGGCGAGGEGPPQFEPLPTCASASGPLFSVSGDVRFQRLVLDVGGLGPDSETRPARFVDVEIREAGTGACFGRGSTDDTGHYQVTVAPPEGTALVVYVFSRTVGDPTRDYTVHQADPPTSNNHDPNTAYSYAIAGLLADGTNKTQDVTVPYIGAGGRPSIGFGVHDLLVQALEQVRPVLGPIGPVHVYTRVGNQTVLGGASFYRPTANAIALLGGAFGLEDDSDTDYFDDAVVLHELGHVLEHRVSHSMSRGGPHAGEPLEPNFAFSEGFASGLALLLLGDSRYVDSYSTNNQRIFAFNAENVIVPDPDGIGSELGVAEIVWDAADGPNGTDGDPIDTTLAAVIGAFASFDPAVDAPYIGLLLDRLVAQGSLTVLQVQVLLSDPEDQGINYPFSNATRWPQTILVNGPARTGTLDSQPGDGKNPCRGLTTTAWYRLSLTQSERVTIDLTMTALDGTEGNLDLFLLANDDVNAPIALSTRERTVPEQIVRTIGPGEFLVLVQADCGGAGQRADYSLSVDR